MIKCVESARDARRQNNEPYEDFLKTTELSDVREKIIKIPVLLRLLIKQKLRMISSTIENLSNDFKCLEKNKWKCFSGLLMRLLALS